MQYQKRHTLEEYEKKYGKRKLHLLKYTEKEVNDFIKHKGTIVNKYGDVSKVSLLDHHKWWKIKGVYYEVPKTLSWNWFKSLNACVRFSICLILFAGVSSAIAIPGYLHYQKYCVTHINVEGTKEPINCEISTTYDNNMKINVMPVDNYNYEVTNIEKVCIGSDILTKDTDYTYIKDRTIPSNSNGVFAGQKNTITIFKSALDAHKGNVSITPKVESFIHISKFTLDTIGDPIINKNVYITVDDINPTDATYKIFGFKIGDENILKIVQQDDSAINVECLAVGTTKVTAYSLENPTITKTKTITVITEQ